MKAKQNSVYSKQSISVAACPTGCLQPLLRGIIGSTLQVLVVDQKVQFFPQKVHFYLFLSHGNSELFLEFLDILASSRDVLRTLYFIIFFICNLDERLVWMESRHMLRFLAGGILSMHDYQECLSVSVPEGRGLD